MSSFIFRGVVCFHLIAFAASTCNHFSHPDEQAGRRVPVDRCIGDGLNTDSRIYECASDGSSVTSKWFNESITCDAATPFVSTVYTSSTEDASFECGGDNACDLCIRTYTTDTDDCSDIDTATTTNYVDNCYINDFCNVLTSAIPKDGSDPTPRSSKYLCLSTTKWTETLYTGTAECDATGVETSRKVECADTFNGGAVLYEMKSNPCTNESPDSASKRFFFAVYCVVLVHTLTYFV